MKILPIFALLLLSACSPYEPLIDLKSSKEPRNAQMDLMECEWLIERYGDTWYKFAPDEDMVRACLKNRGQAVLN